MFGCCQGSEAVGELGHRPLDTTGFGSHVQIPLPDDLVSIDLLGLMALSNLLLQLPQHVLPVPDLLGVLGWIQKLCLAHLWLGLRELVTQRLVTPVPLLPCVPPAGQSVSSWQSHLVCTSTRQRRECRC